MKLLTKFFVLIAILCGIAKIKCHPDIDWFGQPITYSASPTTNLMLAESIFDGRLNSIIQRGKQLLKILPQLGIVVAGKVFNYIPTPSEIFNFSKQLLVGMPQEIIAYAIDFVCKILYFCFFGFVY